MARIVDSRRFELTKSGQVRCVEVDSELTKIGVLGLLESQVQFPIMRYIPSRFS